MQETADEEVYVQDSFMPDDQMTETTGSAFFDEEVVPVDNVTVSYTDTGFVPNTVTVSPNTLITFVNESGGGMWVASDMHPTHQLLPGFDQGESGEMYEFLFERVGTWTYHNDMFLEHVGTIIVAR